LRFSIPYDHPSLAGHFPGRPIVPGVVLLDEAIALLLRERPEDHLVGLDDVKLLAPVLPGDEVTITFGESTPDRLILTGTVGGRTVLRGRIRLRAMG
jgi:3-hydroxyacyl-[acyl-carrier-protein] dehydratase